MPIIFFNNKNYVKQRLFQVPRDITFINDTEWWWLNFTIFIRIKMVNLISS